MVFAPLKKKSLSDILLTKKIITKQQLEEAQELKASSNISLEKALIKLEYAREEELMEAKAFQLGFSYMNLDKVDFKDELRKIIPGDMAKKYLFMPVLKGDDSLTIAMTDPNNIVVIEEAQSLTGLKISVVLSSEKSIEAAIDRFYGGIAAGLSDLPDEAVEEIKEDEEFDAEDGVFDAEDAPIVKYVNTLIHEAVIKNASDVHLEPLEKNVSLRLRIDGKLREFPGASKKSYSAIVSRIKVMANLDIAERRLPQDGKSRVKVSGKKIDIRVSTLPTIHGEKVVMRILQRSNTAIKLAELGFNKNDEEVYKQALSDPYGLILVTGPTGSGKTTSLYAGLHHINTPDRNIVTIEDPVEYELSRINQVQVKPGIELNFANILRSVLRQDPDVVMVGEIRDKETAEISLQASLTGHLVLSTLHTNDAISTLNRLRYMGIPSFLIADAVKLIISQRLIRKICPSCRVKKDIPKEALLRLNLPEDVIGTIQFYHGAGCEQCYGTGYKGRVGIYEVIPITKNMKTLIMKESTDTELKDQALKEGLTTLRSMAISKLVEGVTSVDEVLSVTLGDL